MPNPIEFYFDFSSPYAYLDSEMIDELAAKYGRKVQWRPIMLGATFQKTGLPLLQLTEELGRCPPAWRNT